MPKWLDLPPIWLIAMMVLIYVDATMIAPWPNWPMPWLGAGMIGVGVLIAVWAALSFRTARTTIIPHQAPSALITTGAFAWSRNPIYLADVIVLIGWGLIFGAALAILVVVIFVWILAARFIGPEEERLAAAFGEEYDAYRDRVGRWF